MEIMSEVNSSRWDNDEFATLLPTNLTELEINEANEVTMIVAYVVGILCVIALIFLMAICMDCRQQKLENSKSSNRRKIAVRKILPKLGWTSKRDDEDTITDKMQEQETSSSTANAIV